MPIKVGDIVAIRGDKRTRNDGSCQYTPDQLIDGKYLRHAGHGGIWTGPVVKISEVEGLALVGGIWRPFDHYEVMPEEDLCQCSK